MASVMLVSTHNRAEFCKLLPTGPIRPARLPL